ncbi:MULTISPECIES: succinylglutamate desuccinylase/aspartoacylase family protein [unclassified Burkholderia]|uniref:succinylglutamate desuccinylase/aspartoacylase family protein n=1 Tax=unclassified Burkholderia TaxID=2613784 RepID=UPI000F5B5742|nr:MULTISPECIES: succinylglutamate desuccinylase/aspartoacylase family protein [unclassified Burkholderia]RQS18900.1 succinylglutamate desuccinylase [Burkholderia sp. Bp8995]RQS38680.1 succinylglutamate desuccinylase [Burkholderia sp. Bp8989]
MNYRRIEIPLPSPAPGVALHLTAHRFGDPDSGRSIYLQAGLHADEHPGLLVLQHLIEALHALDNAGRITGCVTVVPYANPIGLSQRLFGPVVGRFDFENGENFNRNFPLLDRAVAMRLRDADARSLTRRQWKQYFSSVIEVGGDLNPAAAMKLELARLSIDHDIVLDLHCDTDAIAHVYASSLQRERASKVAHLIGAPVVMLEPSQTGGGAFDQTHSSAWGALQQAGVFDADECGFSATIELRGQADVNDALALDDARRLLYFAESEGVLSLPEADDNPRLDEPPKVFPLQGAAHVRCPCAGVIVYRRTPGEHVSAGETFAEIVRLDGEINSRTPVVSPIDGVMVVRQLQKLVRPGQRAALIVGDAVLAGREPGNLLLDF